jgi:uncharacterized membrane protein
MENRTRLITISAAIAALYIVLTVSLAPLSYGVLQFRVSEMLKPLALFHPAFAIAFGVGNGIANLFSPFGFYDWFFMALVDSGAALLCWLLRRWPWFAVTVQALVIAAGVALFPLGMGAGLPFAPTFVAVAIPQLILLLVGYGAIWRKYGTDLLRRW